MANSQLFSRPLQFYEVINSNMAICLAVMLEDSLNRPIIEQAWYYTQIRHPFLRMTLNSNEKLQWKLEFQEKAASNSIPNDQIQIETGEINEETWKKSLHEFANRPRALCPALWYLKLHSTPDHIHHQFFLMLNHCGTDGIGVFAILETFLDFLGKIIHHKPIDSVDSLEFIDIQARIPANANQFPSAIVNSPYLPRLQSQFKLEPSAPAKLTGKWFAFDEKTTRDLLNACKKHNVTIQAALTCAKMLAVSINSLAIQSLPHHVVILAPVNMRLYVTPSITNENSVCGSAGLIWEQDIRSNQTIWSLVEDATSLMKAGLAANKPLKWWLDFKNQINMVEPTLMVSSIGRTPIKDNYHGLKVTGVKLLGGGFDFSRVGAAGLMTHAYTVQNSLNVTLGFTDPSFSHEWAEKFIFLEKCFLTTLSQDSEGDQSVQDFISIVSKISKKK